MRLDRGSNRIAPNDLAQGAERSEFLGGLQGRSTLVLKRADTGNSAAMVVKDFGRIDVDFTGEQHAHNQGAYPVLVPKFSPVSQLAGLALSWFELNVSAEPRL
jgi:hypothetical protein